jgi:type IV pilus assembly protein PilM
MIDPPTARVVCAFSGQRLSALLTDVNGDISILSLSENPEKTNNQTLTVSIAPASRVLTRPMTLPVQTVSEADSVLKFQAEPLLPYPINEGILCRQILSSEDTTSLTLFAMRSEHLREHLENLPIDPEAVTALPCALAHFGHQYHPRPEPQAILHLSAEETCCLLADGPKVLASRALPGSATIQANLVVQALLSLYKQAKCSPVSELLVCGPAVTTDQIESLKRQLTQKVLTVPAQPKYSCEELSRFSAPIGAALSHLEPAKYSVNFRQGQLAYSHPWKRHIKPISRYVTLCCLLALTLYLVGQGMLFREQRALQQEYLDLLSALNLQSEDTQLSPHEIMERVIDIEAALEKTANTFPLLPNVPLVSDLLAWLSTHPDVKDQLEIDSLSYSMVRRPDAKNKREKYQVKVDMEFKAETPRQARQFHDSLLSENILIDSRQEVKWSSSRGKYKASFFLKDKTQYLAANVS